jgi:hypothetical protein
MKTKFLIAGVAAVAAVCYFFKFHKGVDRTNQSGRRSKTSVIGENHIREIMKKSKLAV